jgi:formylmethanofuran dehydrogenase subunit E
MLIICSKCGCDVTLDDVTFSEDRKPLCKACAPKKVLVEKRLNEF